MKVILYIIDDIRLGAGGGGLSFCVVFCSFTLFTYCCFIFLSFAFGAFRKGGTAL